MRLVAVTLKNFRGYKVETTVSIDRLTTIIGRNDVGKSSILEALEVFFNNDTVKIESSDCHVSVPGSTIEIACAFTDLPAAIVLDAQAETDLAAEYLLGEDGLLRIKKVFKCGAAKPKEEVFVVAKHPTAAGYADLLELNNAGLKKRLADLKVDPAGVQQNSNVSLRRKIWQSCPELTLATRDVPVGKEDGKKVWDRLSELVPLFALFQSDRASRDSDAEVQDPMKLAVAAAISEPQIQERLTEVVAAVKQKAMELAGRTHQALQSIDPNLAGQLTPEFKAEPKWSGLFSIALMGDHGIPINKRGSGVRRLILVSFFRAEADRRRATTGGRGIIYAIEEPETSQHPHNQRILLEAFQDLAGEPGCQVLLTTHSPGFANYLPLDSFRFVRTNDAGHPEIAPSGDATWEHMVDALGVVPDNRVRRIICVEGPTDVMALRCLSRALHQHDHTVIDLTADPRVAFVVLGGGTLTHWVNEHYLRPLGRPESHIYDRDVAKYAQSVADVNARGDGSWAIQTQMLEVENYLHPDAIQEGLGLAVAFGDTDDVPAIVGAAGGWNPSTTKRKLARYAFPKMTAARIQARDPAGEVEGWLRRIEASIV
jgi:putative ATP-dependent endonuclease of the OLD family